jgi:hypothetical protein
MSEDDGEHFTLAQQSDRKGLSAVLPDGAMDLVVVGEGGVRRIARKPAK